MGALLSVFSPAGAVSVDTKYLMRQTAEEWQAGVVGGKGGALFGSPYLVVTDTGPWAGKPKLVLPVVREGLAKSKPAAVQLSLEQHAALLSDRNKWWGGIRVGRRIFAIPSAGDKVLVTACDAVAGLQCPEPGVGDPTFAGQLPLIDATFGAHMAKRHLLNVPPEITDDQISCRNSPAKQRRPMPAKWAGAAETGGKVFGIPYNARQVLVIEAESWAIRGIPLRADTLCGTPPTSAFKWSGGVAAGGKVFGIPCAATGVLVIDAETETARTIPLPSAVLDSAPTRDRMWIGGVAVGGKVYGIPCTAHAFLCIDVATEEITAIPVPRCWLDSCWWGVDGDHQGRWAGGVAYNGNKVFAFPIGSNQILTLTTSTHAFAGIAVPRALSADLLATRLASWCGPVLPQRGAAVRLLVVDPQYDAEARAEALSLVPPIELATLSGDTYTVAWPAASAMQQPGPINVAALAQKQHPDLGTAASFMLIPSADVSARFGNIERAGLPSDEDDRTNTDDDNGGGASAAAATATEVGGSGAHQPPPFGINMLPVALEHYLIEHRVCCVATVVYNRK